LDLHHAQGENFLHPQGNVQNCWPVPLVPDSRERTGKSGHVSVEAAVDIFETWLLVLELSTVFLSEEKSLAGFLEV